MKSKVAILGANGQIGILILKKIIDSKSFHPIAVVRSKLAAIILKEKIKKKFDIVIADFSNKNFKDVVDCSYLINTAFAAGSSIKQGRELNLNIFKNILKIKNLKKFIQLSSVAVYGLNKSSTFKNPKPHNSYGREKLFHEKYIESNFKKKKIDYKILRIGHIYGCGFSLSRYIHSCERNKKFKIPLPKTQSNFLSKPALVLGILATLDVEHKNYISNLIDNPNKTYEQLFKFHFLDENNFRTLNKDEAELEIKKIYNEFNLVTKVLKSIFNVFGKFLKSNIFKNFHFRNIMDHILVVAPETLEHSIRKKYKKQSVKSQINALNNNTKYNFPDFLFWPPVPKSNTDLSNQGSKEISLEGEQKELYAWYKKISFEID
jgi:nucleoside-diphosphate-sugar epimerase